MKQLISHKLTVTLLGGTTKTYTIKLDNNLPKRVQVDRFLRDQFGQNMFMVTGMSWEPVEDNQKQDLSEP